MIHRAQYNKITSSLKKYKTLVITGPRQVGKTTMIKQYVDNNKNTKFKFVSGDDIRVCEIFSSRDLNIINDFVSGYEIIIIDEAQRIENIGISIKLAVDNIPNVKFILTGSSSFELINKVGEPLVGRKKTLFLFPFSIMEIKENFNNYELKEKLEEFLIFGMYPRVFLSRSKKEKIETINEIVGSYLLKDILMFDNIKKSNVLLKMLKLLAFQIGNEVSLNEIANNCNIDVKTVQRYIDLLVKSFIIYEVSGFNRNLRKEITKKKKYYFYDNGVVNSLISNFNNLKSRDDVGKLWENFIFMERIKKLNYNEDYRNFYFWRTWSGNEIDLVEEKDGKLFAYEFKFSDKKVNDIKEWKENYKTRIKLINKDNFIDFVV